MSPSLWLLNLWRWVINLTIYGFLGYLALNLNRLAVYMRLSGEGSLFRHGLGLFLGMAGVLLLTSAVHELGHLLAGWLARLRFHLLVIGPLRLERSVSGLRVGWQRGGALFNGLAASLPDDAQNLRRRMLLFALGGPVASLLLATAAGVVAWMWRDGLTAGGYAWLWETAVFTTAASFLFCLTTLRPGSYANGYLADGGRIFMLLQNGSQAARYCALVALAGVDAAGLRPRDWPEEMLAQATAVSDQSIDHLTAHILAYQAALDRKAYEAAGTLLAEMVNSWAALEAGYRGRLALEQAYFLAFHRGDGENGRLWLDQAHRRSQQAQSLPYRAAAAVCLAEGNVAGAETAVDAGLTLLAACPPTGLTHAERDWLQAIADQISNRR